MGQDQASCVKHGTMFASYQESQAAIFASGYFDVCSSILSDGLTGSQGLALAESVGIVQFSLFIWHMEYLEG